MNDEVEVFAALRKILLPYAKKLECVKDDADQLYVNTGKVDEKGKPAFFGAVQRKKSYVSYHLMGVYTKPALLGGISPELKRRMQGKSCFNFRTVDARLFGELSDLTKSCFRALQ